MRAPAIDESLVRLEVTQLGDDTDLTGVELRGDVAGSEASYVELTGCRVVGVRFTGGRFEHLRVTDCVFEDCDLSGAFLREAALTRVAVRQSRLSGVVMDRSSWRDVTFSQCKLDDANLRMAVGERVEFHDCLLQAADFYGAKLRPGLRLFDCDLRDAEFSKADVRGARLHGSRLDGLRGADSLAGAVIDPNQAIPLALLLMAGRGIVVDEDREMKG